MRALNHIALAAFTLALLASGRYAYQLETPTSIETRHMTLIR